MTEQSFKLKKGETLALETAKNQEVNYEVKGSDAVVTSKFDVKYIAEANVSGTVDGVAIENGVYTFELAQYKLNEGAPASDAQKALVGKYMFRGCQYGTEEGTFADGPRALYLDNSDFAATGYVRFDGAELSNFRVYEVVNGVKTDVTSSYKEAIKSAGANDFTYNESLIGKTEDVSVVLKGFAAKDAGATVTVNGDNILEKSFVVTANSKGIATGTRLNDIIESTAKNETFKLGTGNDIVTFNALEGFGRDTVVLSKGEKLDLDIDNAKDISYAVKGKDVVVTTKAEVSYVIEAVANGTIADIYTGETEVKDGVVSGNDAAKFENKAVSFALSEYALSKEAIESGLTSDAQKELVGTYTWKSDFAYADINYDKYGANSVNLIFAEADFKEDGTIVDQVFDGVTYSQVKLYKTVNGVKTEVTGQELKDLLLQDAKDLYNAQGEKESSIVIKDFASKDSGAVLTVNGKDVFASDVVFEAAQKKNSYTGTRLNEFAESTSANETFKLGAGNDTISFNAEEGFGKDTVVLSKGESLDLDIDNAKLSYEVKGKDVVVTAKAEVSYVLKAVANGTIADIYTGDKQVETGVVSGNDAAKFENKAVSFALSEYALNKEADGFTSEAQKALVGKYTWKSDFAYADVNYDKYGACSVNLIFADADFKEDGTIVDQVFDGVTYSQVKLYKVVNGVETEVTGQELKDLLIQDAKALYSEQGERESSIVIKDFASKDSGAVLTVNGKDVFASDVVFAATHKKNSFTGSRLNDLAKSTEANETFKLGTGKDTIKFETGFGKDTVVLSKGEELNLEGLGSNLTFDRKGNNIIINSKDAENTVTLKDYLKGNATVTIENSDLANILKGTDALVYGDSRAEKAQTLKGSFLSEEFLGGAMADKIYTGAGNDVINAGRGNDTINVNGEGTKSITIGMNDGNDTINMTSKADLSLTFKKVDAADKLATEYVRKGNDLVINNVYTGEGLSQDGKAQTTTIKNYFNTKYEGSSLSVNGKEIKDSMIATYVTGSKKADKYNFSDYAQNAEIVVTDAKGNDIYNVDSFANNIVIDDKAGNDTLNLGMASKNVSLLFNVNSEGATGSLWMGSSVQNILAEDGKDLEIANYFAKGKIETISTKEDPNDATVVSIESRINSITEAVQGWLADNSSYNDAMAVLEGGKEADINALMAVYQNGTYTKPETPATPGVGA